MYLCLCLRNHHRRAAGCGLGVGRCDTGIHPMEKVTIFTTHKVIVTLSVTIYLRRGVYVGACILCRISRENPVRYMEI